MAQIARNVTMADVGFLRPGQYLLHDRDGKFCPAFLRTVEAVGVKPLKLPPRSPNLNSSAERWVRSVKDECLSKLTCSERGRSGAPSLRISIIITGSETIRGRETSFSFPPWERAERSKGPSGAGNGWAGSSGITTGRRHEIFHPQ